MLECLLTRRNSIVSKSQIEEALYAFGAEIESNTVEVYVSRLRRKLGKEIVETIRVSATGLVNKNDQKAQHCPPAFDLNWPYTPRILASGVWSCLFRDAGRNGGDLR